VSAALEVVSLEALAGKANAAHREIEELAKGALVKAREAGDALREAKEQLPHGGWGAWLRANFAGSVRTAQLYMQVSTRWAELEAKAQRVADLPLRQAAALLEPPRRTERQQAPKIPGERAEQHPAVIGLAGREWYEEDCFPGLLESIRRFGCIAPIVKDQHGRIIDGWLRYHACCIAGMGYRVDIITVADDAEVVDLWCSYNLARQHFTKTQMTMVVVDLEKLEAEMNAAVADMDGANEALDCEDRSIEQIPKLGNVVHLADRAVETATAYRAGCEKAAHAIGEMSAEVAGQ